MSELRKAVEDFERDLRRGNAPSLEAVLESSQALDREELFEGLLTAELAHRPGSDLDSLIDRFPQDEATVRKIFASIGSPKPNDEIEPSTHPGNESLDQETLAPNPVETEDETLAPTADAQHNSSVNTLPQNSQPRVSAASAETSDTNFGDYQILREIARGGMGVVYQARQKSLNRVVALKMILAGQFASDEDVERFRTEAESAANLDHWGIVPIFEIGEHQGNHYFSMGFVEGSSLQDEVRDGPVETTKAAQLIRQVSEAMAYAHERGVIHRDLKPANVLLDSEGQPKITDFGLAKQVSSSSDLTRTGAVMGTPSYMPPEQAAGNHAAVGPAADIYALGAILYCLLTGRPPFQSATPLDTLMQVLDKEPLAPRELNPSIPKDLETITLHCLNKAPERRYTSAIALKEELDRFLTGDPILARPVSRVERSWRLAKKHRAPATLIAVMIFMAIAGPWMAITQARLTREAEERRSEAEDLVRVNQHLTQQEQAQRIIAEEGQKEAERLSEQNRRTLVRARLMQADALVEQAENIPAAIPYYVDALRLDSSEPERAAQHRIRIQSALGKIHRYTQFWTHQDGVNHIAFDTQESMVATSSHDRTVQVRSLETGELVCPTLQHQYPVWSSTFVEQDTVLVTTSGTGLASELRFWNVQTGQQMGEPIGSDVNHYLVQRTPGGNFAAAELSFYQGIGELEVWDPNTRTKLRSFKMVSGFDPDEIENALSSGWFVQPHSSEPASKTVNLHAMDTGQKRGPFVHPAPVVGVTMNRDGSRLATYTAMQVFVWDVESQTLLLEVPAEVLEASGAYLPQIANAFGFTFDSQSLVLGSVNRVALRISEQGQLEHVHEVPTLGTYHVHTSPSGRWLVYNDGGATLRLWDVEREQFVEAPMQHSANVQMLRFTSDERRLVTSSLDGTIRVWDLAAKQPQVTRQLNHNWIMGFMQFNSAGDVLTTWGGARVRYSEFVSGETLAELNLGNNVMWISLPPDSHLLAYGTNDSRSVVLDRHNPDEKTTISYHQRYVRQVHLSPDGRLLLALTVDDLNGPAGEMGTGFVHDVATGELVAGPLDFKEGNKGSSFFSVLQNLGGMLELSGVTSMAVASDSKSIAYGGGIADLKNGSVQPIVRLLDIHSGEETDVDLTVASGWFIIEQVQFSPSGKFLLIRSDNPMGGTSSSFAVYNTEIGEFVFEPTSFPTPITEFAISPQESAFALVAGSTVLRYSLEDGKSIGRPLKHPENVRRICFRGEDGLVTSANDNLVRVWDLQTGTIVTPPLECRFAINNVLVTPDKDVLVASYASVNVWPLQDAVESIADLDRLGRLASAQDLEDGDTTYVTASQLAQDWKVMSQHDWFQTSEGQIDRWFSDRLDDARSRLDWSTETFVREHFMRRYPTDMYMVELQGNAYAVNQQFRAAAQCFGRILPTNPDNIDWLMYQQASALLGAQMKTELSEHCKRFLETSDMSNPFNAERLGKTMLFGEVQFDEAGTASRLINYALEQDPDNPWFVLAKSLEALRNQELDVCVRLASQIVDAGVTNNIRTANAYAIRARARQLQNDWEAAEIDLAAAFASRPRFENGVNLWMDLIHLDILIDEAASARKEAKPSTNPN